MGYLIWSLAALGGLTLLGLLSTMLSPVNEEYEDEEDN